MTVYSIDITNDRIRAATQRSAIAVFRSVKSGSRYNSVFAATVVSQQTIAREPPNLMGVYFGEHDVERFKDDRHAFSRHARQSK